MKQNTADSTQNLTATAADAFSSCTGKYMHTPLSSILQHILLLRERISDPECQQSLAEMELSARFLLTLTADAIKNVNDLTALNCAACDSRVLFDNAVTLARSNMLSKHISFTLQIDNIAYVMLYTDAERVNQVLLNVLDSVTRCTPDGGAIDLNIACSSINDKKAVCRLTVISRYDITRSDLTRCRLTDSITLQLLEQLGGTITAREPGEVTLLLPAAVATDDIMRTSAEQLSAAKTATARAVRKSGNIFTGRRALLCEDNELNARIVIRLLKSRGMSVERAENGELGVAKFAQSPQGYYDIVLMDIRMPVMDGLDATRTIRALPRRDARLVPIIAVTANAFDSDIRTVRDAGLDAHISKPVQPAVLYSTMEAFLSDERLFRRKSVLVVDDVELNRAVIRQALAQDYNILEAGNGFEALELLDRNRAIDALVTDIQMPGMDGFELIRRIRSDISYQRLAIIANTQYGDPKQEERLIALGANDFIYKPSTPKIVELRVRNALRLV